MYVYVYGIWCAYYHNIGPEHMSNPHIHTENPQMPNLSDLDKYEICDGGVSPINTGYNLRTQEPDPISWSFKYNVKRATSSKLKNNPGSTLSMSALDMRRQFSAIVSER
jgi:hypothetical protein